MGRCSRENVKPTGEGYRGFGGTLGPAAIRPGRGRKCVGPRCRRRGRPRGAPTRRGGGARPAARRGAAIGVDVAAADGLVLGHREPDRGPHRRVEIEAVDEIARARGDAAREELGDAAGAVAEEADALALDRARLGVEQRREGDVERAGVDIANLRGQEQRRGGLGGERRVGRGLVEPVDHPSMAVGFAGHLAVGHVVASARRRPVGLGRVRGLGATPLAVGAGERVEVALHRELAVDRGVLAVERPPEVMDVARVGAAPAHVELDQARPLAHDHRHGAGALRGLARLELHGRRVDDRGARDRGEVEAQERLTVLDGAGPAGDGELARAPVGVRLGSAAGDLRVGPVAAGAATEDNAPGVAGVAEAVADGERAVRRRRRVVDAEVRRRVPAERGGEGLEARGRVGRHGPVERVDVRTVGELLGAEEVGEPAGAVGRGGVDDVARVGRERRSVECAAGAVTGAAAVGLNPAHRVGHDERDAGLRRRVDAVWAKAHNGAKSV